MSEMYITQLHANKVRHLCDVTIPLSIDKRKHLILTGKNGSGKTSLMEAVAGHLDSITKHDRLSTAKKSLPIDENSLKKQLANNDSEGAEETRERIKFWHEEIKNLSHGLDLELSCAPSSFKSAFSRGHFVIAFYKCDRTFSAIIPKQIEKVELKESYGIEEDYPRKDFVKYLLDLKMTQALAISNGNTAKAQEITQWFDNLQDLLRDVFDDASVEIVFDEDTFEFFIRMDDREPFDFNSMSSGYAAVFDIVLDLMMRMKRQVGYRFDFTLPGIVLIDEIETHLHLQLQRKILPMLTQLFPHVQFLVSTHSPFVISSIDDVIIYDLERRMLVEGGLTNVPYEGIVEGYFEVDTLSEELSEKFSRYKELAEKPELTNDELEEIVRLEFYLDETPDYLGLEFATEYKQVKLELAQRMG
ncbi:MAG TPA: AAA family ATPase [Candidatus Rubneribacter avistercoris]|nr:AAA family ATPase [Candidatus Rubneribacter avistercoris]